MFFALFSVLKAIAEWKPGEPPKYGLSATMVDSAQHAKILGVTIADKFLSAGTPLHVRIVILLAVLVSMVTTYLTVRQSMKRGMMPTASPDNPMGQSQKYMTYIMPFFALSGLYWPFGLVLYWVTTNLWTLGQQYVLFRRYPQPPRPGRAAGAGTGPPARSLAPQRGQAAARPDPDRIAAPGSRAAPARARPDAGRVERLRPGGARRTAASPGSAGRKARSGAAAVPGAAPPGLPSRRRNGGGMLRRLGKGAPSPSPRRAARG